MSDPRETPPRFTPAQLRYEESRKRAMRTHTDDCRCVICHAIRHDEAVYSQAADDADRVAALTAELAQVTQERDKLQSMLELSRKTTGRFIEATNEIAAFIGDDRVASADGLPGFVFTVKGTLQLRERERDDLRAQVGRLLSAEPRACETCRFWRPQSERQSRVDRKGWCRAVTAADVGMTLPSTGCDSCDPNGMVDELSTLANFCCAAWTPKEDAPK